MDHFSFSQVCKNCKKDCKTFEVSLSNYNADGSFKLPQVEINEQFSFVCSFCNCLNIADFEQACNPNNVWYLKRGNELNKQIQEVINELLQIKIATKNIRFINI